MHQARVAEPERLEIASNRDDPVARTYVGAAAREQPVVEERALRDTGEPRPDTAADDDGVRRVTRDLSCGGLEESRVEGVEPGWCERTRAGGDSLRLCRANEARNPRQSGQRGDDERRDDDGADPPPTGSLPQGRGLSVIATYKCMRVGGLELLKWGW